ncbi:uncharacterized protein PAC_18184 [Phialocephala subalpina]|uniref:Uncharacterized protein n=1 Tax=Phialocephala subalpina TaxID=576137 RepID=A0A1L7XTF9_9HELO|nr:uncharacterized protein PAC_18184 [Phialocephala subalpina]
MTLRNVTKPSIGLSAIQRKPSTGSSVALKRPSTGSNAARRKPSTGSSVAQRKPSTGSSVALSPPTNVRKPSTGSRAKFEVWCFSYVAGGLVTEESSITKIDVGGKKGGWIDFGRTVGHGSRVLSGTICHIL